MELHFHAGAAGVPLKSLELGLAVIALEAGADHLGDPRPLEGLGSAELGCLLAHSPEVQVVVLARDRRWLADLDDATALDQHRPITEALHRTHVMGYEHDRAPRRFQTVELVEAFLLEAGIADREDLV